jgi:hypothetical protein
MAPKYPLGTKSADGSYAIGKNGHTLPLEFVPMLRTALKGASKWDNSALYGGNGGGNNTNGGGVVTPPVQPSASSFQWQFPQYSQTWAFTPPAPSAFRLPPAFDPKTSTGYAAPPKTSTTNKATTPFSVDSLWRKYP